ncbi:hypothetical protein DDE83_009072 [Stemphylium lycopersici]|uniref:Uncharacterized protein n=1 Tax=Stemphylium lycopersici TaxID=183478 RepID=A0A364MRN2_STELY|nr:hypothetical protein DDE83_009072 [Stemphylium lycopersici]
MPKAPPSRRAECSLFVSEEEWERVAREKREKRLELARLEEDTARVRRELLEVEAREHSYADRDLAVLNLQERAQEEAEGSSAPSTDLFFEPPLPEPSANLGWLQADVYDPSFDYSFLFAETVLIPSGFPGGTPVLNFLDFVLVVFELYVFC